MKDPQTEMEWQEAEADAADREREADQAERYAELPRAGGDTDPAPYLVDVFSERGDLVKMLPRDNTAAALATARFEAPLAGGHAQVRGPRVKPGSQRPLIFDTRYDRERGR